MTGNESFPCARTTTASPPTASTLRQQFGQISLLLAAVHRRWDRVALLLLAAALFVCDDFSRALLLLTASLFASEDPPRKGPFNRPRACILATALEKLLPLAMMNILLGHLQTRNTKSCGARLPDLRSSVHTILSAFEAAQQRTD